MSHRDRHGMHGFTLLELSVVLVIIAVILGTGLTTLTAALQASQYNVTVARMDTIEKALLNYAIVNKRIPCPADLTLAMSSGNYGVEAGAGSGSSIGTGTGACTGTGMLPQADFTSAYGTAEGGVPTRALQLPDDYMYDGWGRKIRYAVNTVYTALNTLPASASACPPLAITVNDATGTARTTNGIYVLVSHGTNGHGAYSSNGAVVNSGTSSADKLTNCHCSGTTGATNTVSGVQTTSPGTYVQKAPAYDSGYAGNASYFFDDIVAFKEPWQLQAPNFSVSATSGSSYYLAVGLTTSPYVTLYCMDSSTGAVIKLPDPTDTNRGATGAGVGFSTDNTLLAWGGNNLSPYKKGLLYAVSGAGLTYSSTYDTGTGGGGTQVIANEFSPDNPSTYLAETDECCKFLQIFKKSGNAYNLGPTLNPSGITKRAGAFIYRSDLAWKSDLSELYVDEQVNYVEIYTRSGDTFTMTDNSGSGSMWTIDLTAAAIPAGTHLYQMSLDPSNTYLAVGVQGVHTGYYKPVIIKNPDTTPTVISTTGSGLTYASGTAGAAIGVAWSPVTSDGYRFLAVGADSSGLEVFSFNKANADAGTTPYFTAATLSGTACPNNIGNVAWSKDGSYLAAVSGVSPYLCLFSRSGTTFTRMTLSTPPVGAATIGISDDLNWSH